MYELYELKEMLMDELKEYGEKGEMTSGTLDVVDKLSHAIKNLCKIIESYEDEEYSATGGSYNYRGGNMGYSRARGRRGGRGANQYGSYASGTHGMVAELRDLMYDAPNEHVRKEFEKFITKVESM